MNAQKLDQRGPGTTYHFVLGRVNERVERAVEERDDDERVQYVNVHAYLAHRYQQRVYLVRQITCRRPVAASNQLEMMRDGGISNTEDSLTDRQTQRRGTVADVVRQVVFVQNVTLVQKTKDRLSTYEEI